MPRKTTYTTKEVAALLGRQPNTIAVIANRHGIGTLLTPRMRAYTERDVARLRDHLDPFNRNVKGANE